MERGGGARGVTGNQPRLMKKLPAHGLQEVVGRGGVLGLPAGGLASLAFRNGFAFALHYTWQKVFA